MQKTRLDLAENTSQRRRRALVLGRAGTADLIAAQMGELGFDCQWRELPPGVSGDRTAGQVEGLREFLAPFAAQARPTVGLAHFVHPGVTAWAERPEFPTICQEFGLAAVCPSAKALTLFSNKLNLIGEAEKLGIPNLVASFDPIHSLREIEKLVERFPRKKSAETAEPGVEPSSRPVFPFVLKSIRGESSGRLQVIHEHEDLRRKIPLWLEQLQLSSGEAILFAERYLEGARLIVVPFVRFAGGEFRTFPLVDASLQARFRKVVEFCPAFGVDAEVEARIILWSRTFAESSGYVGVGAFEFLVDGSRAFLIEGSARLKTGFHLWEKVAGVHAVEWQMAALDGSSFESVAGYPYDVEDPSGQGQGRAQPDDSGRGKKAPAKRWASALGLRIYAEDSLLQLPQPGWVQECSASTQDWSFPGSGAELRLAVAPGTDVSPQGDGFLGQLWAGGRDRKQALTVARRTLDEVWIAGSLQTNERFLGELLEHPWVKEGIFHAGFVEEEFLPSVRPPVDQLPVFAAVCAAVCALAAPATSTYRWAVGDQWAKLGAEPLQWIDGPHSFRPEGLAAEAPGGISGRIALAGGEKLRVCVYPLNETRWQVRLGNWVLPVKRFPAAVAGAKTATAKRTPKISALVAGQVHSILFREGAVVPAHEPLLILRSLKMLIPHALPVDVRIHRWRVGPDQKVNAGDEVADFEVLNSPDPSATFKV